MLGIELDFTKDYYKALDVVSTASPEEIKKARNRLAQAYHPDVNKNAGAEEKYREVQTAFEIVGDDDNRRRYDEYRMAVAKQAALEKNHDGSLGEDIFQALFNRTISLNDFIASLSRRGAQPPNKRSSAGAQTPSTQDQNAETETVAEELARARQELARRRQELQDRIDKMRERATAAAPQRPVNTPPTAPAPPSRLPFDFSPPEPAPAPLYDDVAFAAAAGLIAQIGQVSPGTLEFTLGIENEPARAIIDEMERRGWVGPFNGTQPREILDFPALRTAANPPPDSTPYAPDVPTWTPPSTPTPSPVGVVSGIPAPDPNKDHGYDIPGLNTGRFDNFKALSSHIAGHLINACSHEDHPTPQQAFWYLRFDDNVTEHEATERIQKLLFDQLGIPENEHCFWLSRTPEGAFETIVNVHDLHNAENLGDKNFKKAQGFFAANSIHATNDIGEEYGRIYTNYLMISSIARRSGVAHNTIQSLLNDPSLVDWQENNMPYSVRHSATQSEFIFADRSKVVCKSTAISLWPATEHSTKIAVIDAMAKQQKAQANGNNYYDTFNISGTDENFVVTAIAFKAAGLELNADTQQRFETACTNPTIDAKIGALAKTDCYLFNNRQKLTRQPPQDPASTAGVPPMPGPNPP